MATDLRIGTTIGGYTVESLLGRGGMSAVYLAEDPKLGRRVALKVMSDELAENDSFRTRFIREAQMAANLEHPSIVPVYDAGEADGVLYLAMRVIRGTDLRREVTTNGPMEPERLMGILRQVASALDTAHRAGLVHRDVKPANVLLSREGDDEHAYLTDFGLTKHVSSKSGLTRTGQFMGTIDYVAPEQIRGNEVDGRTDLYSLGCVTYECLTGALPFTKDQDVAILFAHLEDPRPLVTASRPELPAAIDGVVARAMAREPSERYESCLAFIQEARVALELGRGASGAETAPVSTPTMIAPPPSLDPHPSFPPADPSFPPADPSLPPGEVAVAAAVATEMAGVGVTTPPAGATTGASIPPPPSAPAPGGAPGAPSGAGPKRGLIIVAIVAILAVLGAVGAMALSGGGDEPEPSPEPVPSVTQAPSPTPSASPTASPSPSSSPSPTVEVVAPVRAPLNVRSTAVTTSSVTLTWGRAPNGGEAVQFLILRDGKQVGKTNKTTFTDDGLTSGTTFAYEVVAVGEDGSRARSQELSVTTASVSSGGDSGGGGGNGGGGDGCTVEEFLAGEC